jgi:hypothetical protein
MKSPFPGMDPFLEKHWRDVHHRLCTYACDALQPQLRPALVARIEERLIVEDERSMTFRSIYPDTKIVERRGREEQPAGGGVATLPEVVDEPIILQGDSEPATEGRIEIIDPTTGGRLVTVIEFLSTSNKLPGEGQKQYRQKQTELRAAGVSLVEIDLLREGEWTMQAPIYIVPPAKRKIYGVIAHRGWNGGEYEYYPIALNQRLPTIRIPLRQSDADARLNLQTLIDQTYTNGAYDGIDYTQRLQPPFDENIASWIDSTLRAAGKIK